MAILINQNGENFKMTKIHSMHSVFIVFLAWVIPQLGTLESETESFIHGNWPEWQAWALAIVIGAVHYVYQRAIVYLTELESK